MKADIVVFDPQSIRANATFDQPKQYPDGIEYVIVNGVPVIDNGVHTGAPTRPGAKVAVAAAIWRPSHTRK